MQYTEAFRKLGFVVEVPRQDWSAANDHGVALALWKKEVNHRNGSMVLDTREHCGPIELWGQKPGNKKRIAHLAKAQENHGGVVSVVIVDGEPGGSVKDAYPKNISGYEWRITFFDQSAGHFRVELLQCK